MVAVHDRLVVDATCAAGVTVVAGTRDYAEPTHAVGILDSVENVVGGLDELVVTEASEYLQMGWASILVMPLLLLEEEEPPLALPVQSAVALTVADSLDAPWRSR